MEFRTGVHNALKAVSEVVGIEKKSHELGEPIDFRVIAVNEPEFWFLRALSIR
jgi:hypothetical protein